jgi:hypothetical protein
MAAPAVISFHHSIKGDMAGYRPCLRISQQRTAYGGCSGPVTQVRALTARRCRAGHSAREPSLVRHL